MPCPPRSHVRFHAVLRRTVDGMSRECREETGLCPVMAAEPFSVVDGLFYETRQGVASLSHHYVLVTGLGWAVGEPHAADDASDARWVALSQVEELGDVAPTVMQVVQRVGHGRWRRCSVVGSLYLSPSILSVSISPCSLSLETLLPLSLYSDTRNNAAPEQGLQLIKHEGPLGASMLPAPKPEP